MAFLCANRKDSSSEIVSLPSIIDINSMRSSEYIEYTIEGC